MSTTPGAGSARVAPSIFRHAPSTPGHHTGGVFGRGQAFAARWADVIFTIQQTQEQMKRFTTL